MTSSRTPASRSASATPGAEPGAGDVSVVPAAPAPRAWLRTAGTIVVMIVVVWHSRECLVQFPPGTPSRGGLPFTADDHPFHYYYSQRACDFYESGALCGYDPTFMAGYAKTLIFPTSSTLYELVALATGRNLAFAYRLQVAVSIFLTPFLLSLAAWSLVGRWSAAGITLAVACAWVWTGWPARYCSWGMGPFILAAAASVCAGCMLAGWLDTGRLRLLLLGSLLATIATIMHPSSPVILVLVLAPAYLARFRSIRWTRHLVCWSVPCLVLLAWSPWWVPAIVLRDTFGSTSSGFHHAGVAARLLELATARFAEETALIITGIGAIAGLRRLDTAKFWAMLGGMAGLFALAYLASGVQTAWFLQPGRYTQPLFDLILITSVVGYQAQWPDFWCRIAWTGPRWIGSGLRLLCLATGIFLGSCDFGQDVIFLLERPPLTAKLPPQILALADGLRGATNNSARILFEDRGRAALGDRDPFPGVNPSALLPLLVPRQYIGGPYLYTHLKANFAQVGDGFFFGRDLGQAGSMSLGLFQRYADQYNLGWMVVWSARMIQLADGHPERFDLLGQFGSMRVYRIVRSPNWAVVGFARVIASTNRLEVFDAEPDDKGTLILSYHWIHTLRSSVPLRPVYQPDDPVPFIAVDHAPRQFVIENRMALGF